MAAESAVRILFLGDTSSAVRSVGRLETAFGGLGRTAKLVSGALGIALVGSLAASTKAAIDFDRSMRNVNSIAKVSEKQFQSLEKRVLALAGPTGQTPKILADGLYDIVSSGFKANDAIKILAASAKAATAGMTDTATASKAVVAILNAYHLSADKARNVSSLLFTEVNKGVNTFEELAQNIGDTAPLAASLKIPFSQVAAGLALITLHGTSMAEAATQMSRVMADLLKPSKGLSGELHKMGFESGQAAIQQLGFIGVITRLSQAAKGNSATTAEWFQNIRSLRGMLNLTGPNLKKFNEFARDMAASFKHGGADIAAFNEQSKSIAVQWQKAKAALIAASIPIGQLFFPALVKAAQGIAYLANTVNAHMPQIRAVMQQTVNAVRDGWQRFAIPAINAGRAAVVAITNVVRAHWPAISATARSVGAAIRQGIATGRTAIETLKPLAAALGPLFKAAFAAVIVAARVFAVATRVQMKVAQVAFQALAPVVRVVAATIGAGFNAAAAILRGAVAGIVAVIHALTAAFNAARAAVEGLSSAIRSIPTPHIPHIPIPHIPHIPGFATGGIVPGSGGEPKMIVAHAGEVILNPAQQARLGGPGFFSQMFGFRGEGPSFASGGIVRTGLKKPPRAPHHSPHAKGRKNPDQGLGKPVANLIRQINKFEDSKAFLDQEYQNLSTRYSIADGDQSFINDDGTVNTGFVSQRQGELVDLIAERQKLLDLMEDEKRKLEKAIQLLRAAVKRLMKQLGAEGDRVRSDTSQIGRLTKQITTESAKKKGKNGKGGPDRRKIAGWRHDISNLSADRSNARHRMTTIRSTVGRGNQLLADYGHDLRFLPLDEAGVGNDITELQQQLSYLGGPDAIKTHYGGGNSGASASDGGVLDDLLRQIGVLKLALGIQEAQVPIIGAFSKGTLYVPETGLAMVHAGESISPPGTPRGSDGGSIGDIGVQVELTGDLQGLEEFVRVQAIKVTGPISREIGTRADLRKRSGRF